MLVTVSRSVVPSFHENRYCFGCSKPTVGADANFDRSSKEPEIFSGLSFGVSPKRRRSCREFGMPPNPALNRTGRYAASRWSASARPAG
jgi:hypothetical protein